MWGRGFGARLGWRFFMMRGWGGGVLHVGFTRGRCVMVGPLAGAWPASRYRSCWSRHGGLSWVLSFFFSKSRCTQLSITIPVVASVNLKSGLWSLIFLRHLLLIHSGFCVCSLCNLCSAGVADVSWRVFVMSGSAVMV